MNPVDDHHRKYCGSKLLYGISRNRQPVFLQRNLRKVLDHHEHSLNIYKNRLTNATTTSELAAPDMRPNNEHPRLLPSMDILSAASKPMQQTLRAVPMSIVKKRWTSDGQQIGSLPMPVAKPVPSATPWLPAPNHVQIKCNLRCNIHIYDDKNDKLGVLLHTESHLAILTGVEDDKGDIDFAIDTKPFIITEDQMFTTHSANHNGSRRWKTKRPPQVVLSLVIECFNSEHASQLLSIIDPDTSLETTLSPAQAQLRAHWKRLSVFPIPSLSALRRYRHEPNDQAPRANVKQMDYLLRAFVSWSPVTKSNETPLATCNHVMQALAPEPRYPLPTTTHPHTCHITYVFDGGPIGSRSILRTKMSCVFCPDRLPHPTFDRLHFHYLSFHDHFTFRVHRPVTTDSSLITRTVIIDLAVPKYERASDSVCDEREIAWIKPKAPFDLQQYLSEGGSNAWASGKQLPLKIFPKTAKPSFMSKGVARSKVFSTNGQLTSNMGPPAEVKEVPSRKRKRYVVPVVPGVAIFRAESKREVQPGEALSESDAEVDDTWLRTKHEVEDFPQLTGAARQFAGLFDGYLLQDEPRNLANIHVGEAVVRFARRFAVQLRQPHLRQELKLKLDELMEMDLISDEYVDYCLALAEEGGQQHANGKLVIKEEFPGTSRMPPSANLPGHNTLDVIMIDDSDSEPGAEVSPATFPRTKDNDTDMQDAVYQTSTVCVCGKVALGSHKVITCQNIVSLYLTHKWIVD